MKTRRPPKKRILIADDSPTMRAMVQEILTGAGHEVLVAEDGLQAAALAFEHRPDLIVSDIEMPNMDGYQVCRLLKGDPALADTPVIILTSRDSSGSVFWGYQTGADLYLLKDFKPEELTAAVDDLFAKYADRRPADAGPRPAGGKVDALQVLEKLNQLLDGRLFEMTLMNEINRVSVSLTSLSETLGRLLSVLDKAIDGTIIGFAVFSDEKQVLLNLKLARAVPPRILELFEYSILEDLALMVNEDIADYRIDVEVIENGAGADAPGELPFTPECVFSLPLRAKEENLGVLNVYHPDMARLPAGGKQLLEKLGGHLSSAISAISMYNRIKSLSVLDGLTQLYNRRYIMEAFKQEFNKALRYNAELSIMMMDIDNFKRVNDTYGHLSGDLVLKGLAGIIKSSIRNIDLPGRYGGEEFILVLPETGRDNARVVAERIRAAVEKHPFKTVIGEPLQITISIGLASLQPAMKDLSTPVSEMELIKIADAWLYMAKRSGRNRVVDSAT